MKWKLAKSKSWRWVDNADEFYVAARFLYWKGFLYAFAFMGSHAIELYLKAFLIFKTGKYPRSHDLGQIYQCCIQHGFPQEETVAKALLPYQLHDHTIMPSTWTRYLNALRYPEQLTNDVQKGFTFIIGIGSGCTYKTLDRIACCVRGAVTKPEGTRDYICQILAQEEHIIGLHTDYAPLPEIKKWFLTDNEGFVAPA